MFLQPDQGLLHLDLLLRKETHIKRAVDVDRIVLIKPCWLLGLTVMTRIV